MRIGIADSKNIFSTKWKMISVQSWGKLIAFQIFFQTKPQVLTLSILNTFILVQSTRLSSQLSRHNTVNLTVPPPTFRSNGLGTGQGRSCNGTRV